MATHPTTDALADAATDAVTLVRAVTGLPMALVDLCGAMGPTAQVGLSEPERPEALALARRALAGEPLPQSQGLCCVAAAAVPMPGTGLVGLLAALQPASDRPTPLPDAQQAALAAAARCLSSHAGLLLRDARLDRIATQVPGALYQFVMSADGRMRFPYASDGLRDVYGVDPASLREDAAPALRQVLHPDDLESTLASAVRSAQALTPWEHEYRVCFADGSVHWVHGRAAPERLPDGGTQWFGFLQQIDARRQADEALRRSEASLRHFFEAGLVGMTIAGPDRRWLRINGRMAELLGYTLEELEQLDWSAFTHPDDLQADEAQYARMAAGEIDGYVMDKRYRRKDGSTLECALAVRCDRGADGQMGRVYAIVQDISARRRAEAAVQAQRDALEQLVTERTRELVIARDEAEQASRAKTDFLASMSHELRTPLNAILGFAQLLELDPAIGARSLGHLREVLRAGRHLLRLINEVLDLAQVESGRLAISAEALSLNEVVADATALSGPLADARTVTLHTEVPADLVVRADRMRLKQVLLNLLSNAVKYNRPGGHVRVTAEPLDDDRVRLVVSDTGPGLSADQQGRLFQPFSRLGAEFGTVEGTGIGLALSQRLMALMGGEIGVDSRPGEGSRFWVRLPRARLATSPSPDPAEAQSSQWDTPPATVLYVEDNPANLALVEQIVARHHGVRLVSATTGRQGLEQARTLQPALLLLDIHLPEMDGYELLARLRADPRTRHIPAVALTAQAMPSDARRAIQAGFDEYLAKPIDIPVFDSVLRRLLGGG